MKRMRDGQWRFKAAALALLVAAVMLGFAAGWRARMQSSAPPPAVFAPIREALEIIEARYVDAVAASLLVEGAISGMVAALEDEHSGYIKPELYRRATDFSGEFTGIGVMIKNSEAAGELAILSVIAGSPAARAGVKPGDVFYEVDGQSVSDFTLAELSAVVPGPRGSAVTITFQRADRLVTFDIIRDTFPLPNVSWKILSGNIAYIALLDFNDRARTQLEEALSAAAINNRAGLLLDLRGNHGGKLTSAVEVASAFIKEGALMRQTGRDANEELIMAHGDAVDIAVPVAVLVDETSASAAELLAGALQAHDAATIVGAPTFGKGTVQSISQLSNGGGLRLSTSRWLTADGRSVEGTGIHPNILVEGASAEPGADAQLEAALAHLRGMSGG